MISTVQPQSIFAGDFDRDGKLDLAFSGSTQTANGQPIPNFAVMLGNGDGTFREPLYKQVPIGNAYVADFNGDGKLDLMVGSNYLSNTLTSVYMGNGDGTFGSPISAAVYPVAVADLNNDGIPDVIGNVSPLDVAPSQYIFLGRGDGTFGSGHPIASKLLRGAFVAGDFNGDGKPDLVVSGSGVGDVYGHPYVNQQILIGNGDGTFQTPTMFTGVGGTALAADFNHDGKLDLYEGYSIIPGNGDGTFGAPLFLSTPPFGCTKFIFCGASVRQAITADLNGDELPDIIYEFSSFGVGPTAVTLLSFLNAGSGDGILASDVPAALAIGLPATNSIVSAYGADMAPATATASGPPFPTTLGGISVHIGDKLAQLFYVSPAQINYVLPPWSSGPQFYNPPITIERIGQPFTLKGVSTPMVGEAPGLFSVDSSGLAAATAVRIALDGTQTPVPVFDCSSAPCTAIPIDTSGDPVYVSLYATGMNNLGSSSWRSNCITSGTIVYAGPQGEIPGMQQINIKLKASTTPGTVTKQSMNCNETPLPMVLLTDPGAGPLTTNAVYIFTK